MRMRNSIWRSERIPGSYTGNTSGKSQTSGTFSRSLTSVFSRITWARNKWHSFRGNLLEFWCTKWYEGWIRIYRHRSWGSDQRKDWDGWIFQCKGISTIRTQPVQATDNIKTIYGNWHKINGRRMVVQSKGTTYGCVDKVFFYHKDRKGLQA